MVGYTWIHRGGQACIVQNLCNHTEFANKASVPNAALLEPHEVRELAAFLRRFEDLLKAWQDLGGLRIEALRETSARHSGHQLLASICPTGARTL